MYVALTLEDLDASSHASWCGWRRAAARAAAGALARRATLPPCIAWLPTYGGSAVAVVPVSGDASRCTVDSHTSFAPLLLARLAAGVALFAGARSCSKSPFFRVSAGAASFAALSAAVVVVVLVRSVPSKKALTVALAAAGSSAASLIRLLFGHWVPTAAELASRKVFGAYLVSSLSAGAALAYWYDDPDATKAHAILAAFLRLVGLGLVVGGVSWPPAGLALAASLALAAAARRSSPALAAAANAARAARRRWLPARKGARALRAPPPAPTPPLAAAAATRLPSDAGNRSPTPHWASATGELRRRSSGGGGGSGWLARRASSGGGGDRSPPRHTPISATPAATLTRRREAAAAAAAATTVPPSPLVARGLVLNEATGKTIKIGAATYNRLVLAGYTLDEGRGTLTPPPGAGGGALARARRGE